MTSAAPAEVVAEGEGVTMPPPEENCAMPPTRVKLNSLEEIAPEQVARLWDQQNAYVDSLEARLKELEKVDEVKGTGKESSKREALLTCRLTVKEQELQEMVSQIAELKAAQAPSTAALRNTLIDPAVNLVIQKLTKECDALKKQAEEARDELAAWKFTPDSATGKRLMAKCRQLYQENEDLGKMIASGRLAKLEGELALQKNLTEEMKKNQLEMDEFMAELDEDVEGMQSTIYYLQQQLREAKETIARLEAQNGNVNGDELAEGEVSKAERDNDEVDDLMDGAGGLGVGEESGEQTSSVNPQERTKDSDERVDQARTAGEWDGGEGSEGVVDGGKSVGGHRGGRTNSPATSSPSRRTRTSSNSPAPSDPAQDIISPTSKRGKGRGRGRPSSRSGVKDGDQGVSGEEVASKEKEGDTVVTEEEQQGRKGKRKKLGSKSANKRRKGGISEEEEDGEEKEDHDLK